jgi:hypothetical protein
MIRPRENISIGLHPAVGTHDSPARTEFGMPEIPVETWITASVSQVEVLFERLQ